MIKMKKYVSSVMAIISALCVTGCSSDSSVYTGVSEQIAIESLLDVERGTSGFLSSERYLNWCLQMKWYAIPVIVVSMLIGLFLIGIFRNEKKIQKTGLFLFILGIPTTVFVIVYLACGLYGKLF